ncbi:MAG: class I SAM-dependent DNA methyltransferase [Chloroflexi bacterium]|nr:class I SAM-dependent DNA methyltransferase [Chloroflexota bacterium]
MLTWTEIETRATAFQKQWKGATGDEKQQDIKFIADFLNVFGVDWRSGSPQHQVFMPDGAPNYIDFLLPGQILIEMKSKGRSLDAAYTQALAYLKALKPEESPRLLMLSDFNEIRVFNLEKKHPYKPFKVSELRRHTRVFSRLAGFSADLEDRTEIELNTDASYKLARLHDALKDKNYTGHSLEVLLVRLLFCLFADDTGIFEKGAFKNYIQASNPDGSGLSERLLQLFAVLDTPPERRVTNLPEELRRFRYIDGALFSEPLPPAWFDAKMRAILLECCEFDWTLISPAIFGAMFQGVMNPAERRELGAHYTSEENILKVIKPLFLDQLQAEFERSISTKAELQAFLDKIASLTFLDPACGSGNFLIIAYHRLRQLEFAALKLLHSNLQLDFVRDHTRVSLNQFYGIELEDFPCQIAKVSMLLMKHLCDQEISAHFGTNFIDFPIKDNANIIQGNALRMDWNDVVPAHKLNYIMGNPPFVGYGFQSSEQKSDMQSVYVDERSCPYPNSGKIDYVAGWFFKTAHLIYSHPSIKACFVATNSVTQGDQVEPIWKPLHERFNLEILFAYQTFRWDNEAKSKAAVHCVIIGFGKGPTNTPKLLFQNLEPSSRSPLWKEIETPHINFYLSPSPVVFIEKRTSPISDAPPMITGNRPTDGGHLIIEADEYEQFITKEPGAQKYIKRFLGAREFLHNEPRYCLWLVGVSPKEINAMPLVKERVRKVKETRENSPDAGARNLAFRPAEFRETNNPKTAIIVPRVSSENRLYIPIGFVGSDIICGDQNMLIPDGTLYEMGVISSSVHMAWVRAVAGRLKSDYRYSAYIVYNNFPWPQKTEESVARVEKAAQAVLDARTSYPDRSCADLYDPLFMPPDLRKAHQNLDKEVIRAYGKDPAAWSTESAIVSDLMQLYQSHAPEL